MPFNIPTITTNNITFGPARLFLGVSGATPTVDVGAISEDGVTVEMMHELRDINQGNPKTIEITFAQVNGANVRVTSIEWNFDNLIRALGAGVTATVTNGTNFSWGGDPCLSEVALHIQHQMCLSGHTMNAFVWRAYSDAGVTLPFTHDEHQFEYRWRAARSANDWNGVALAREQQLVRLFRQTA